MEKLRVVFLALFVQVGQLARYAKPCFLPSFGFFPWLFTVRPLAGLTSRCGSTKTGKRKHRGNERESGSWKEVGVSRVRAGLRQRMDPSSFGDSRRESRRLLGSGNRSMRSIGSRIFAMAGIPRGKGGGNVCWNFDRTYSIGIPWGRCDLVDNFSIQSDRFGSLLERSHCLSNSSRMVMPRTSRAPVGRSWYGRAGLDSAS